MTSWPPESGARASSADAQGTAPSADALRGDAAGGAPARSGEAVLDSMQVQRSKDGDAAAFRALYERFAPMVHGVLVARARPQEADDLMQDVFLSAWRHLHHLRSDEHFGGWLASIARRRVARFHARARPPAASLSDRADGRSSGAAPEPADPRAGRDGSAEILATLQQLPDAYRETLAMRLIEGLTGPEIAAATGLTHGSVRVNLSRGMKLLQERLRKAGWP